MSASITLSGAAQQGVSHKILATLRRFEIVEVNERLNQRDFFLTIVLNGSATEIENSPEYLSLQELAKLFDLKIESAHHHDFPKAKLRTDTFASKKRLIVLDVDSTLIQEEVIELLANKAGAGAEVARITAAAMSGEMDFATALDARVKLLTGLPESVLAEAREEISLTSGARELIIALKKFGHNVGIVSGGFIDVIEPLAKELNIDYIRANKLEVIAGKLTGKLTGAIIDRAGKAEALKDFAKSSGVEISATVAIGDGANDIDMLKIAGIGIAFNAKPILQTVADISLNSRNLDLALYLIDLTESELADI